MKLITSRENPLFQALKALAEQRKYRRQMGQTLLDGEHLLEEALQARIKPLKLIFSEGYPGAGDWEARLPDVPVVILSGALFQQISPVIQPSGVLALISIADAAPQAGANQDAILLEAIQDPGNLGSIFRAAAAAGIRRVFLSKGCADAWSPKTLRGGQGAQFRLEIHESADLPSVAAAFPGTVLAAALGAEQSLYSIDLRGPVAFAFGNEGAGLSEELVAASSPFSIPMHGGVESLNVGAAAAVCFFEAVRQRL